MASLVATSASASTSFSPISESFPNSEMLPLTEDEIDRLYDLVIAFSQADYKPWIRSLHRFAGLFKVTEALRGKATDLFELYKSINNPETILTGNKPFDTATLVTNIAQETYILLPSGQDAVKHIKHYATSDNEVQKDLVPWMQMYISMMSRLSRLDKWSDLEAAIDDNEVAIPEELTDMVEMVRLAAKLHRQRNTLDLSRHGLKKAYKATDVVNSQTMARLIVVVFATGCGHCSDMAWLKRSAIRASDKAMIARHEQVMEHLQEFTEATRPTSIECFEIAHACATWGC